jgi:hypothetical protein
VEYEGETLIASCKNPFYDAARVLLDRGITGGLVMHWHDAPYSSMSGDIEGAAKVTVRESERQGPKVVPWKAHPRCSLASTDGETEGGR